ncbi:hypothetical protein Lal_00039232 [Lupinus albus]|nr:hypothetical protein Lal_00039232 [Lupinus albus]
MFPNEYINDMQQRFTHIIIHIIKYLQMVRLLTKLQPQMQKYKRRNQMKKNMIRPILMMKL